MSDMTPAQFDDFLDRLFLEVRELLNKKRNDYTVNGESIFANFQQSEEFGVGTLVSICIRIGDKVQRLKSYCKNGKLLVAEETVADTFLDLIGYCILALAFLESEQYL